MLSGLRWDLDNLSSKGDCRPLQGRSQEVDIYRSLLALEDSRLASQGPEVGDRTRYREESHSTVAGDGWRDGGDVL